MATQASVSSRLTVICRNSLWRTARRRLTHSDGGRFIGFVTPPDAIMLTVTPTTFSRSAVWRSGSSAFIKAFLATVELFFFGTLWPETAMFCRGSRDDSRRQISAGSLTSACSRLGLVTGEGHSSDLRWGGPLQLVNGLA